MSNDEKSDYERGYENGSKVQSAADVAAETISRFVQTEDYVAGYNAGQADRANGNA